MKNYKFFQFISIVFTVFSLLASPYCLAEYHDIDQEQCPVDNKAEALVLKKVEEKNPDAIKSLSSCLRTNHKLIFQACLIDPSQMANAAEIFREDENFSARLIKINPQTLQYISDNLRKDKIFVEKATYINRDALKYADESLLDNKLFMERMIKNDSRNYIFASKRIKSVKNYAKLAFEDDGLLIKYAPAAIQSDKELVKIALNSNVAAFDSIDADLKKDKEILKIIGKRNNFSKIKLEEFLKKKYIIKDENKNVGNKINKNTRFFKKHALIERNYIVKWQRHFKFVNYHLDEKINLIAAQNRNYPILWKEDLKKYPALIKKVEEFFLNRYVDKETINNMSLTYLWKIKNEPLTLAFNLYLLRESTDSELSSNYSNATSLTVIAKQITKNHWKISVVEALFGNEIKMDIGYDNAHKKYILQDLYLENKTDKNPKLIFRVEDKYDEYFEIFEEQLGHKYRLTYRINPLKIKGTMSRDELFGITRTREEQEEFEWLSMMEKCQENAKCALKIGKDW